MDLINRYPNDVDTIYFTLPNQILHSLIILSYYCASADSSVKLTNFIYVNKYWEGS